MKVLMLEGNEGVCAVHASGALRRGEIILYPTDTLYGLGADAFSDSAVDSIFEIKDRDPQKPIHCVCADLAMAEEYAEVNDAAKKLAEKFLPGALTLILKKRQGIETGIGRGMNTIGIRIPDNSFCIEVARSLAKPYTATSANLAGLETGLSISEVLTQLGSKAEKITLAIDAGTLPLRLPSTVVNVVSGNPVILREGAISKEDIEAVFR